MCLCLRLVLCLASDSTSAFVLADFDLVSLGILLVVPTLPVTPTLGAILGVGCNIVEEIAEGTLLALVGGA